MEDWFNHLMSYAAFFMATVRSGVSLFDDRQVAGFALGVFGTILIQIGALVRTSLRLRRSARVVRSLNAELAQAIQDFNVERLWRLVGGEGAERPSPDSLTELYRILSRHHGDAGRIA